MIKPVKILSINPYSIVCLFSTGEKRQLDMGPLLAAQQNIEGISKLYDEAIFRQVCIGEAGQLFWKDITTMKDEKGNTIPCEYDISPEFAYYSSLPV